MRSPNIKTCTANKNTGESAYEHPSMTNHIIWPWVLYTTKDDKSKMTKNGSTNVTIENRNSEHVKTTFKRMSKD